jgi:hypothetical protein
MPQQSEQMHSKSQFVAAVGLLPVTSLDAQIGSSCRPSMSTIEVLY